MSFYTALTGLNAATAQLGVTSNNIANVGTAGFKRSRADFGDIFATSPLQQASSVVGQGVSLKKVSQEFSQGNIQVSSNALDLAITGDGFFPLKSGDGLQDIYTRNGSFTMNDQYNVVNSAGQALMAATVLVNIAPANPYLAQALQVWPQGNFLNFNGLTHLVSSLWPFAAMAYLLLVATGRQQSDASS